MSNSKKTTEKSPTQASKTSSTQTEKEDKQSDQADKLLGTAMAALKDLTDFHAAVEEATGDDLRIYWDVRVVRGEKEPYARSKGVSSLPGALSEKQRTNAPAMIQQEVVDKIATPLVSRLMKENETSSLNEENEGEPLGHLALEDGGGGSGGKDILKLAKQGASADAGEVVDE